MSYRQIRFHSPLGLPYCKCTYLNEYNKFNLNSLTFLSRCLSMKIQNEVSKERYFFLVPAEAHSVLDPAVG